MKKLYHLFDENGYSTGETKESANPLANGFVWAPPESAAGLVPAFNGFAWEMVKDIRGLSLEDAKMELLVLLEDIKMPRPDDKYSMAESYTWEDQRREATAWRVDQTKVGPFLKAISEYSKTSVEDVVKGIEAKCAEFDEKRATRLILIQGFRDRIVKAVDPKALPTRMELVKAIMKARQET